MGSVFLAPPPLDASLTSPQRPLQPSEISPSWSQPAPPPARLEIEPVKRKDAPPKNTPVFNFQELHTSDFWRAVFAEFLATKFFVAFSIAGVINAEEVFQQSPGALHAFILLYHIVLIIIVIYAFGAASGSHFNPAVSFGTLCAQRITVLRFIFYVIAQMGGSIVGAAIMQAVFPDSMENGLTVPHKGPGVSDAQAFLMELYCTMGLVFGAFAIAFDPRGWGKLGPLAVGVIVAINLHAGGRISGAAMNPVRAWGPAVATANFDDQWIYWGAGMAGGMLGGVSYEYVFMDRKCARPHNVPSTQGDATCDRKNC